MEACRIFLYQFLSLAFSYPDAAALNTLDEGLGDLDESIRRLRLSYDAAPLGSVLMRAGRDLLDLQGEHNSLFATSLKAPARETAYELDKASRRAAELADIEGFYRAFGLRLRVQLEPDSLVAELEFLSWLLQKELYALRAANQEGAEICPDAYRKFLADHLGRWCQTFAQRLQEGTESEFYRSLGELLKTFLAREMQRIDPSAHSNRSATFSPL